MQCGHLRDVDAIVATRRHLEVVCNGAPRPAGDWRGARLFDETVSCLFDEDDEIVFDIDDVASEPVVAASQRRGDSA